MAPKKPTPMEDPPAVSSTEEEEEDSSSEDENSASASASASSSEDEEEKDNNESTPKKLSSPPPPQQQQQTPKKPETTPTTPKPASLSSSESESEESESESDDNDSEPEKTLEIKPIATKPMEETPKTTTKPRSKLVATSAKSLATKRTMENDRDSKDLKKVKKGVDGVGEESSKKSTEDPKKQLFQRLWSEDDEIAVLKGMLEYSAKKGVDPMADMNAFLEYIKTALHFDVTKVQLHDKIRRLKKKYGNNLKKGKKGEDRSFSKEHEQISYDLSKKIWGGEAMELSAVSKVNEKSAKKIQTPKANGKALPTPKLVASPEVKKMEIDGNQSETWSIGDFDKNNSMEEYVLNRGLELVDGSKRTELEERWRKLQLAQLELFVERSGLIFEQAKLVLEAAKSSNH